MTYAQFKALHDQILGGEIISPPYDREVYLNYVRLNKARMKRWDKRLTLDGAIVDLIQQTTKPMHWIILTEPWCGDAAHVVPFLDKMSELNPLINYDIQLRDSEPHLIEDYLTNGARSIPKIIVRDEHGTDLFTWGPRPKAAQRLLDMMKNQQTESEKINIALQHWYNEDRGQSMSAEIAKLWKTAVNTPYSFQR